MQHHATNTKVPGTRLVHLLAGLVVESEIIVLTHSCLIIYVHVYYTRPGAQRADPFLSCAGNGLPLAHDDL